MRSDIPLWGMWVAQALFVGICVTVGLIDGTDALLWFGTGAVFGTVLLFQVVKFFADVHRGQSDLRFLTMSPKQIAAEAKESMEEAARTVEDADATLANQLRASAEEITQDEASMRNEHRLGLVVVVLIAAIAVIFYFASDWIFDLID
ncbi:MAG: hypothetical protein CMJ49_01195 [Planctomycetaceae bacterium]|nr:hypothetical protein [Planctomycetaceae bacterium]